MGRLVLASGSRARSDMLRAAGIAFEVQTSQVDEAAVRDELRLGADGPVAAEQVALALAIAKASATSADQPGDVVIGADQVLALGDEIFSKAGTVAAARAQLQRLRGCAHALHSAVTLVRDGEVLWMDVDTAELSMRDFSDAFLDAYLDRVGEDVCHSVGAYHLEGLGIQLFDEVRGDYFTILGMPLLPLLAELRRLGMIAA
jgi:septum formation protein